MDITTLWKLLIISQHNYAKKYKFISGIGLQI